MAQSRSSNLSNILNSRNPNTIAENGWNSADKDFKKKGVLSFAQASLLYVIVFPRSMFKENANNFDDIEKTDDEAVLNFTLIQYVWHCLYWATLKINTMRSALDTSPYPFRVFIEDITDDDDIHVEWRMYILMNEKSSTTVDLGELLATACVNVSYKLNQEGVPLGNSKDSKKKPIEELYSSVNATTELYKKITNPTLLTNVIYRVCDLKKPDHYRQSEQVHASIPDDDDDDQPMDNEEEKSTFSECFSITNAFRRVAFRASNWQRNISNYLRDSKFTLDCDKFPVYEISPSMWHPIIMKRRLLHKEIDSDVYQNDQRIGKMKDIIKQHAIKKSRMAAGEEENQSADELNAVDIIMNQLASITLMNISHTDDSENSVIRATRVQEDVRDLGLFVNSKEVGSETTRLANDPLRRLARKLEDKLKVIHEAFVIQNKVGSMAHNAEIARAKQAILLEYGNTSISPNMDRIRRETIETKWDVPDVNIPITDLSLSAVDNFLKWLADGAYHHLDVTYHGPIVAKTYVALGDHWRSVKNEHLNILFTGNAATGKSFIINQIGKMICEDICTSTDRQSPRRFAMNGFETDMIEFSDEADFSTLLDKEGQAAELRTRLSKCTVLSEIMDLNKNDGRKRAISHYTYEYIAQYLKCTNISGDKVAKSNKIQQDGMYALMSRFACWPVNAVSHKGHRSVTASNSKINKSKEEEDAKQAFLNTTKLIHRIRGEYYHAVILKAVPQPAMDVFDQTIMMYMKNLEKYGIRAANHRFNNKMSLYCMALATLRAIINQYFVPTGLYYKQKYECQQLASLVVICNEDDVISTFSAFFSNLCPVEMNDVIRIIDEAKSGENGFEKTYCDVKMRDRTDNMAHSSTFTPPAADGQQQQQQPQQPQAPKQPTRADFMCIKGKSPSKLVDYIYKMTKGETTQPSNAVLESCLDILQGMTVMSDSYILNPGETKPVVDTSRGQELRFGLIYEGGNLYINTHIIHNKEIYSNLMVAIIKESFHKATSERKVLLMTSHHKYPWLFTSIQMERNPDVTLQVCNPHYITNHTMLTSTNVTDRTQLPLHQQKEYIELDGDVDAIALFKNIGNYCPTQILEPAYITQTYHQQSLKVALKDHYEKEFANLNDDQYYARFENYPKDAIDAAEEMDKKIYLNDHNNLSEFDEASRNELVGKQTEMLSSPFVNITTEKVNSCMDYIKSLENLTKNNRRSVGRTPHQLTYTTAQILENQQQSMAANTISRYGNRTNSCPAAPQNSQRTDTAASDLMDICNVLPSLSAAHFGNRNK